MVKCILTYIILLFAFLIFSYYINQQIDPKEIQSENKIEAKFNFDSNKNHLIIPTLINNSKYNFKLDTGSGMTVFGQSIKSELGNFLYTQKLKNIDRELFTAYIYETPEQFQVGPHIIKGTVAYAESSDKLDFSPWDGLWGVDFLKYFIVKVDFDDSTITISKNQDINDVKSGLALDIIFDSNGIPLVNSKVNGVEAQMSFDTGLTSISYLSENIFQKVAEQEGVDIFNIKMRPFSKFKTKETIPAIHANLQLNSLGYENLTFLKRNSSVLGMDFIRLHKCVIFDFPNNKIYLSPRTKLVNDIHIKNLGIILEDKNNVLAVKSIDQNSKAYQSGLRENDIILKIEDVDINITNIFKLPDLLKDNKKDNIKILIMRSSDNMVITCPM